MHLSPAKNEEFNESLVDRQEYYYDLTLAKVCLALLAIRSSLLLGLLGRRRLRPWLPNGMSNAHVDGGEEVDLLEAWLLMNVIEKK